MPDLASRRDTAENILMEHLTSVEPEVKRAILALYDLMKEELSCSQ